jgi:hypothetical protein
MVFEARSVQHYVPQFILREFAFDKKYLWVFDKKDSRVFKTVATSVACESNFYDISINGDNVSLEGTLSKLESDTCEVTRRIIREETVQNLSPRDRKLLCHFLGIQFARTKQRRLIHQDWMAKLEEGVRLLGLNPGKIAVGDQETKELTVVTLLRLAEDLAPLFWNKKWFLCKTTKKHPFYISDNPITLQNAVKSGPFKGSIGLGTEGVEIHFPLNKTLSLTMSCPDRAHEIVNYYEKCRSVPILYQNLAALLGADTKELERFIMALQFGQTIQIKPQYVNNLNSLQVINSSRFVFSSTNDFDVARQTIESDPNFRKGPTMTRTYPK